MAGGQAIDLQSVGKALDRAALEQMHRMKTGALLAASVRMGAILAGLNAQQLSSLDQYAKALGLGFQVVDDILDVTQDSQVLGKTAGKDAQADKPTFVSLMGLENAQRFANELNDQALRALEGWGDQANSLRQIAHWVTSRKH
jgi:farnesyl diphosphate synthase